MKKTKAKKAVKQVMPARPQPARKKTSSVARAKPAAVAKPATVVRAKPARAAAKLAPRADYGAPIDGFFARQSAQMRPLLDDLRGLVEAAAPDAESALKWGIPVYSIAGVMMCAIGGHKAHVNLVLPGPPGTYSDPDGRLGGEGKTGRHLQLRPGDEVPRASVRAWLATAADLARAKSKK